MFDKKKKKNKYTELLYGHNSNHIITTDNTYGIEFNNYEYKQGQQYLQKTPSLGDMEMQRLQLENMKLLKELQEAKQKIKELEDKLENGVIEI